MDLHSLVKPGETVVYATRGESFTEPFVTLLGLIAGGSVLMALILPGGVWTIMGIFFLLVTAVTISSRKEQQIFEGEVVVTEHRLLFQASDKLATVIDIPLSGIQEISWSETGRTGMLRVATDSGIELLSTMREPDALAQALAKASGQPTPPTLGRMVNPDLLVPGCFLLSAGSLCMILHQWLQEHWIAALSDLSMWGEIAAMAFGFVISLIAAVGLAVPVGRFIGVMLTVTLMKPCVTAEEMRIGLRFGDPSRWHRRAALRWAGILHGDQWASSQEEPHAATAERSTPAG